MNLPHAQSIVLFPSADTFASDLPFNSTYAISETFVHVLYVPAVLAGVRARVSRAAALCMNMLD